MDREDGEFKRKVLIRANLESLELARQKVKSAQAVETILLEQAKEQLNLSAEAIEALLLERRNHNGE